MRLRVSSGVVGVLARPWRWYMRLESGLGCQLGPGGKEGEAY
jgi:hypothetical protein